MNKKLHVDYGAIHASYWMLFGVTSSFASAFLLHAGYTNGEIGIILAVGNVLAVFLQPLIADFADRTRKISLLGVLQLCTILLMLLEAALFVFGHKSAALWVVFAMIIAWMTVLHPLINSLSFKLQEAGIHINFGVCRSMGSLFFSILCGILGTLVERHGVGILPVAGEMTLAALLLALFLVGGLVNNLGSHCAWVVPFYAVTVLPVFYFLLGVGRLCRGKERITQMDLEDGIQRGQRSALSLTVLGALWVLSDLVFLIARGAGGQLGRELIFMLCGAATAGIGVLAGKQLKGIGVTEEMQEVTQEEK